MNKKDDAMTRDYLKSTLLLQVQYNGHSLNLA